MNGVYSEGIVNICGQYGSVVAEMRPLLIRVAHEGSHTDHLLLDIALLTDAPGRAYGCNR